MVIVHSQPSASPIVMDESSFYHSLHELKLQLDRMNQRTSTLLRHHNHPASVPVPSTSTSTSTSEKPSSWLSHGPLDARNHYQPVTDYRPEPGRAIYEAQLNACHMKLLEFRIEASRKESEIRDRNIMTPPSSPGSAVHDTDIPKPTAEPSEVGYLDPHFDAHKSQIQREFHHLYTSNPMTFVARLSRASRTKSIPSVDRFLRGPALRWYNIGLRRDGSHWYDVDGEFKLDTFCDSLLAVFGCEDDIFGHVTYKGQNSLIDPEKPSLVEDYAFPALEVARYRHSPSIHALIDGVHDTVMARAEFDNVPVPTSPFSHDQSNVSEYLRGLRAFECGFKLDAQLATQAKKEVSTQQQQQPETFQHGAEDTKVTPKASKADILSSKNEAHSPETRPQYQTRQSIFNHEDFIRGISSPSDSTPKHKKPQKLHSPIHAEFEKEWCEQKTVPIPIWTDMDNNNEKVPTSWSPFRNDPRRKERRPHSPFSTRRPFEMDVKDFTAPRHISYDEWRSRRGNLDVETRGGGYRGHSGRSRWEVRDRDESPYARVPHHARSFEDSYSYMRPTHAYAESVGSDTY